MKFKKASLIFFIFFCGCCHQGGDLQQNLLNDVHSRLNPTRVDKIEHPKSTDDLVTIITQARKNNKAISISGGRHAMGGQQFAENTLHISMKEMDDVLSLDKQKGIVKVEAGITWPKLINTLLKMQENDSPQWGIIQKQTGADQLTLGGALSANAHGRGVYYKPIIQDVESFTLVDSKGQVLTVNRDENRELFGWAIGGYGLFGVIATVDLRLKHRQKIQRHVEVVKLEDLHDKVKQQIAQGAVYGDFQYKTDSQAKDFMKIGVLSTYIPVPETTLIPESQKNFTAEQWYQLLYLAHVNKQQAFDLYSKYYLMTNGQIYWSDTHQLSFYVDGYIEYLEKVAPDYPRGSLMITEVYVPRNKLSEFIEKLSADVHEYGMDVIYGTMRLIERDDESFLAWAKENYACIILNLRVEHNEKALANAEKNFQRIIDRALELEGSYFLTYHRWARRDQLLQAYPQFSQFMKFKLKYDPQEMFQSEWYRHYKRMFADSRD